MTIEADSSGQLHLIYFFLAFLHVAAKLQSGKITSGMKMFTRKRRVNEFLREHNLHPLTLLNADWTFTETKQLMRAELRDG